MKLITRKVLLILFYTAIIGVMFSMSYVLYQNLGWFITGIILIGLYIGMECFSKWLNRYYIKNRSEQLDSSKL